MLVNVNSSLARGLAQMARALGLGPRGREFESRIPEMKTQLNRLINSSKEDG